MMCTHEIPDWGQKQICKTKQDWARFWQIFLPDYVFQSGLIWQSASRLDQSSQIALARTVLCFCPILYFPGQAKAIWRQSGKSNLEFWPIWLWGKNNSQSGKLTRGFLVLDWIQSGKTLKCQIAHSNLGQSGNLGQIAANLARLLWLGQFNRNEVHTPIWTKLH